MIAMCMNISMCADLYLAYKNPFYPGYRRMKFYLIGTAFCIMTFGYLEKSWLQLPPEEFETELMGYYFDDTLEDLKNKVRTL